MRGARIGDVACRKRQHRRERFGLDTGARLVIDRLGDSASERSKDETAGEHDTHGRNHAT